MSQPINMGKKKDGEGKPAASTLSLKIGSFKSILDQTIELGSVNVFIGANRLKWGEPVY